MYLLDTTALIDLIERLPRVLARFGQSLPGTVFASVISQGEVMIGLRLAHRLRPDGLTSEVERAADLLDSLIILPVTSTIASAYATIQADLMSRGKARLRINDGWIAATALEHHLTLVTSDTHLKSLADMLRVEDWRE